MLFLDKENILIVYFSMEKIILKNCDVKELYSLIKRSSSVDNAIFINLRGSEFESTAYNKNKSALKSISANLEEYCGSFTNNRGEQLTKIQSVRADKFVSALNTVSGNVDVVFYIEDDGYASKITVSDERTNISVPTADKNVTTFLAIPEQYRDDIFIDTTNLCYKVAISENEFKYFKQLYNLNKDSSRVCFAISGEDVIVSEIDGKDDNVRDEINEMIENCDVEKFNSYEKLYSNRISYDTFESAGDNSGYLKSFNKTYFGWLDDANGYEIEFHTNKIKFVSVDEKGTKTYVVYTPVPFAA